MAHILIVDDDDDVVGAVQRRLRRHGHEAQAAYNGPQALRAIRERRPDLVILDIMMPGMDGIEVCRRLRADTSTNDVPILFLTAKGKLEDKIEGFEVGADDYLTKPFEIQELELRVKALLRRSLWGKPGGTEAHPLIVGGLALDPRTFEVQINEKKVLLTPVEFELLHYLMTHHEEVISSERLLQEVWKYPVGTGAPDLVRVHIKNIRDKIEPVPRQPQYIRTVSRHGYTVRSQEAAS